LRAKARTQSSIAVSGQDPHQWVLVNASPDIRAQLEASREMQPNRALRDSAIAAVVLSDGQVDHTTGLYMLRESTHPWQVWCTDSTYADLTNGNPVLGVLAHFCGVERRRIELDVAFTVPAVPDLEWRALAVASKPAPYSPNRASPVPGDNIALILKKAGGESAVYAPGLGAMDEPLWRAMQSAACVLVDGTFWTDDEMVRVGVSSKRARDIGHLPQSGRHGMLEWLERLPDATRKILIHINNTNPILNEESAEFKELGRRGIEVARDGVEIAL
jgi:pyrroloquinoline quinone biosynthesis protein B